MNQAEQDEWLCKHIPHRVRAAIARLDVRNTLLNVQTLIDPDVTTTTEAPIWWRCSTDAIWEGRLTAIRWLIEFVGIQQDFKGKSTARRKTHTNDVDIADIAGGAAIAPTSTDGAFLADVWKGCSQASSHATNAYGHPSVNDQSVLPKAMAILLNHLQSTIYKHAGMNIRDYVLTSA